MRRAMAASPASVAGVDVGEDLVGRRIGARPGRGHGVVDELPHGLVDGREVVLVDDPGLGRAPREGEQAVARAPYLVDLAGGAVGLLVALEVPVVAHALALDERRTAAR